MNKRTTTIGVTLCLMAMAFFAGWPFWKWVYIRSASRETAGRVQRLVVKNPQLKPALDVAMLDGALTIPEARIIVEAAGEHFE